MFNLNVSNINRVQLIKQINKNDLLYMLDNTHAGTAVIGQDQTNNVGRSIY